jgi:hypothetical protein
MSMGEAALYFNVSISTIGNWLKTGVRGVRLPGFRIGGRRFVRRVDAEAFLDALQGEGCRA